MSTKTTKRHSCGACSNRAFGPQLRHFDLPLADSSGRDSSEGLKVQLIETVRMLVEDNPANTTALKSLEALDQELARIVARTRNYENANVNRKLTLSEKVRLLPRRVSELVGLFKSFREAKKLVDREYSISVMDENLWSLRGFHQATNVSHYRTRTWKPVNPEQIDPSQTSLEPREFLKYALVSMEIEDPIQDYSRISGQSLRFILPNLARFMGSTAERFSYMVQEKGKKATRVICEATWCHEENRHANAFAGIFLNMTGRSADRSNPNYSIEVPYTEAAAVKEFAELERQSAERRAVLANWPEAERKAALEQEAFEKQNRVLIDQIIANEFAGFKGAEIYESSAAEALRKKIVSGNFNIQGQSVANMSRADSKRWRIVMADALRHYQIRNNWFTLDPKSRRE